MQLQTEWIRYGNENEYVGYHAKLDQLQDPAPVVLVIQEIWGVDNHIQDLTRRFAQAGYIAFAPDLYSKHGKRPDALEETRIEKVKQFLDSLPPTAWANVDEREAAIKKLPEEQQVKVSESLSTLFGGLNLSVYMDQLRSTTSFLTRAGSPSEDQGVASVGYCMGGALSVKLAAHDPELKGAVIYYGNAPSEDEIKQINCPVLGFYGGKDVRITSQVPTFAEQMKNAGKAFTYYTYESAHHAFFNDTRASYDGKSARDAFAKTLQFFVEVLD